MTSDGLHRRQRRRSQLKRDAIVDAAQTLFAAKGYNQPSVDDIASSAEVSKRTLYDHFGDKARLYDAVIERVAEDLLETVRAAIEVNLPSGCDLRIGLLAFVRQVATDTFSTSSWVLLRNLAGSPASQHPQPSVTGRNAPRQLVVDRMAQFSGARAIIANDPAKAADHFIALTFLLALDPLSVGVERAWAHVDDLFADGVDAFLRAYT